MSAVEQSTPDPAIGGVYRDESDRSFLVLAIDNDKVMVEYADGGITSFKRRKWPSLRPRKASF